MKRMSTGQVTYKYQSKRIGKGQRVDNHQRVICWLSVRNFEHNTLQQIHCTSTDINIHVTDKTDMDGWVPNDQWITIYGIHYSSIPSICYSVTGAFVGRLCMAAWPYFLEGLKKGGGVKFYISHQIIKMGYKFYIFAQNYENEGLNFPPKLWKMGSKIRNIFKFPKKCVSVCVCVCGGGGGGGGGSKFYNFAKTWG